jgi:hypothetical protein
MRSRVVSPVSIVVLLLVLVATLALPPPDASASDPATNTLTSTNQELLPGQFLTEGNYELVMQTDGNLVLYLESQGEVLWASQTEGIGGAYAVMQSDGNFVVYSTAGRALWASGTNGDVGDELVLQPDGNLVVYGSNGPPLWSTGTEGIQGFELTPGETLQGGQSLRSPNGRFAADMQTDGNFVVYNAVGAYFQTDTAGNPGASITLQSDGNLVVSLPDGHVMWTSQTQGSGTTALILQNDSNVVAYKSTGAQAVPTWATDPTVTSHLTQAATSASVSVSQLEAFVTVAAWESTLLKTTELIPRLVHLAVVRNSPIIHSTVATYLVAIHVYAERLRALATTKVDEANAAAAAQQAAEAAATEQVIMSSFGAAANTSAEIVNNGASAGLLGGSWGAS